MPQGGVEERRHVEGVSVRSVYGGVHAGAVEVQGKDRKEHDHEPNLCENEEFQRRVSAVWAPPKGYQEEQRGDEKFPAKNVEEEDEEAEEDDAGYFEGKERGEERRGEAHAV